MAETEEAPAEDPPAPPLAQAAPVVARSSRSMDPVIIAEQLRRRSPDEVAEILRLAGFVPEGKILPAAKAGSLKCEGGDACFIKKTKVLVEIVSTEDTYVDCVTTLLEEYYYPLRDAQYTHEGPILPMEKVMRIFSNLEAIVLVNSELLDKLKRRIEDDGSDRVGDIFLSMSFALKLYQQYITNYDIARATLHECDAGKFSAWRTALEGSEAHAARTKHNLESLLIMPVQRIPRYVLLLRELQKTKEKLGDQVFADELDEALETIKRVATDNNEAIRAHEAKEVSARRRE